jgi:hypothetical protein
MSNTKNSKLHKTAMRKMTDIAVLLQHELLADAITFCAFEEK